MATVSAHIALEPQSVFDVLSDGWRYTNWVVGTSHMRAVEADWPAAGSRLFHCSGPWPIATRDETIVEEVEPGKRLQLLAKGGPFGSARIEIELEAHEGGTKITLTETPVAGVAKLLRNPINDAVLGRRNVESLARLAAIAEQRTEPVEGSSQQ